MALNTTGPISIGGTTVGQSVNIGGIGGKAIALNGRTATITGAGIIYGAVS